MEILGTYTQTEIGHGSDIAGLRTTATFDAKTQEFIINTPDELATKWWPGDVGLFATHTVVFAVLVLEENPVGVMPFIVQIRDLKTAMPMPGMKLGDMGPKFGYNSKSNGWASFDNVRIPRDQMLMRFVSVDEEGGFSIEGDTRILYAVMMNIRMQLIDHSGVVLSKALITKW
jgi:acyl-CoA oxidase